MREGLWKHCPLTLENARQLEREDRLPQARELIRPWEWNASTQRTICICLSPSCKIGPFISIKGDT